MFNNVRKEPLTHFVMLGILLFILNGVFGDKEVRDHQILIEQAEVDQLLTAWIRRWNRQPSQQEFDDMVAQRIREEVLYREALTMGLENDDPMVRRRMMQKMEFILEDLTKIPEPSTQQLQTYLNENSDRFSVSAKYSFKHVFFSADSRGDNIKQTAEQHLEKLLQNPSAVDLQTADGFHQASQFTNQSSHNLARLLGKQFTAELKDLPKGKWSGPIASGFGLHLVFIQHHERSALPKLEDIKTAVQQEWTLAQRTQLKEKAYNNLRENYEVEVQNSSLPVGAP